MKSRDKKIKILADDSLLWANELRKHFTEILKKGTSYQARECFCSL